MVILFDLDGTLVDSATDIVVAIERLCEELHHPLPDRVLLKNNSSFGLNRLLAIALSIDPNSIDPEQLNNLRTRFRILYNQTGFIHSQLFPGMLKLLTNLRLHGCKIGIVTNKRLEFAQQIINKLGIENFFDCVITSDLVKNPKPAPDPVLLAIDKLQVQAKDCIFIGDAEQDIIAGKIAGVTTIAALFGYIDSQVNTNNWGANYYIASSEELWPLLQRILKLEKFNS